MVIDSESERRSNLASYRISGVLGKWALILQSDFPKRKRRFFNHKDTKTLIVFNKLRVFVPLWLGSGGVLWQM
jgi:hypothetical protein